MIESTLAKREQWVLKKLIECYIQEGQPVGSHKLAKHNELSLSAATIRHVMADLEAMGYLHSPHTSAGRVPTDLGYRLFVNGLLQAQVIDKTVEDACMSVLNEEDSEEEVVKKTSRLLSRFTSLASLVTTPKPKSLILKHIEFLKIDDYQILVILVLNQKEVQNRIIKTERPYERSELERLASLINQRYAGQSLEDIRKNVVSFLKERWKEIDQSMRSFLHIADEALQVKPSKDNYIVTGEANLMGIAEEGGMDKFRLLMEAFAEQQELLKILDRCLEAEGVQIFIGSESSCESLDACSLITARYQMQDHLLGVLAVIGPTRMDYKRIIPIVDITAKLLTTHLN